MMNDRDRVARAHTVARRLVRYCFRDLLEPFHGDMGHKIDEGDMRELMIAFVNNAYTFLAIPEKTIDQLPEPDWNEPRLNHVLLEWLALLSRQTTRKKKSPKREGAAPRPPRRA
jgi:hypothetical protein